MSENASIILQWIDQWLRQLRIPGWLVGGAVRDRLLAVPGQDLDVAIAGEAMETARQLANATDGHFVVLDGDTDSARVIWDRIGDDNRRWTVDLVRLRAPSIEADLRLRDFTVNALAVPVENAVHGFDEAAILDPCGGIADLRAGLIRTCGPRSLVDDPLRMLRAIRIAAQFKWKLDAALLVELHNRHGDLGRAAGERIRDELIKLLKLPHAARWLQLLDETRLLPTIIGELEPARDCDQPGGFHYFPVLAHLLEAVRVWEWIFAGLQPTPGPRPVNVPAAAQALPELSVPLQYGQALVAHMQESIDGVPRQVLFKLALLMHDIAKPQTKAIKADGSASFYDHPALGAEIAWEVMRRLHFSKAGCSYVRLVVNEHMRPGQLAELGAELTRRAIYRFFKDTNGAGPDVLLHMLCDYMAMRGPWLDTERWNSHVAWIDGMLTQFYDVPETVRPERLINGRDLMEALGLTPGPIIGDLLEAIREAQASGEVDTPQGAIELARRLVRDRAGQSNGN